MNARTGWISRWIFLLILWWGIAPATAQQQPGPSVPFEPGVYSGRITIAPETSNQWEYRFVGASDTPHTAFFLPLDGPIVLDTPPDTRSTYRIQFRTPDRGETADPVTYVVDRSPPPVPQPEVAPGLYTAPITVRPHRTVRVSDDVATLQYLLRADGRSVDDQATFRRLNPDEGIELTGQTGRVVDYVVVTYATDTAENRSGIGRWTYRIDRRDEPFSGEPIIVSPVNGTFSNPQLLLLRTQGLRDISVELTGPDGAQTAPYDGEMIVDGAGEFSVTARGTRRDTGESVSETVRWTQGASQPGWLPRSGRYTDTVTVSPGASAETPRYRLDDTDVRRTDDLLLQRLSFSPDVDTTRHVTIRTRTFGDESRESADVRAVYLLDGRRAPPPDIVVHNGEMILFSLSGTEISYRVQPDTGEEAESFSHYTGPVSLADLPVDRLSVVARARFPGSEWGATANLSVDLPMTRTSDTEPSPETEVVLRGQTLVVTSKTGSSVTLSESGSGDTDAATLDPVVEARGTSRFAWTIPVGFRATLKVGSSDTGTDVLVDNTPPAPPDIVVSRNRFRFDSPDQGEIRYRIDSGPFQTYDGGWIRLSGESEARVDRRIEAYSLSDDRMSPRTVRTVVLDARPVVIPPFHPGVTVTTPDSRGAQIPVDGEIITGETPYTLLFSNPHRDFSIHYESATGELPPLPAGESSSTTETITLQGVEGGEQTIYLRLRGRFEGRDAWSPIQTYRVILDQEPPAPPVLVTPSADVGTNESRVSIAFAEPEEPDVNIWYRTRGDERFQRYRERFDVVRDRSDGAETVLIEAFAEDIAGNRAYLSPPRQITFREGGIPRPLFTVNGRTIRDTYLLTPREAVVGVSSGTGDTDRYTTMWRVYPLHVAVPPRFEPFESPAVTQRDDDDATSFVGEAYRVDRAGQRSSVTRLTVRIDPDETAPVGEPEILRNDDGRSGALYWPGARDRDVYVSQPHLTGGFERVEETAVWRIPENTPRISVLYFVVDEFGRRSETRTLSIDAQVPPAPPSFLGVTDNAVYTGAQTLRIDSDGPVRYTMTTDGSEPPAVHPLSTPYEEPIELTAAPGEDRTYRLRAQHADSAGENAVEATITVRIDRNRPEAPRLVDVDSGSFLSEGTDLAFQQQDDAIVYYRLTGGPEVRRGRYLQYTEETGIRIDARPGELRSYLLEAYAVDQAGNRSQTVSSWELFVDREIVYVDSEREDGGRGTRNEPFSSLDEALRVVRDTGRRTVFLTAGTHRVAPALLRDAVSGTETITISGGYRGDTWERAPEETVLEVDPVEPIVAVDGDIRLQQLVFGASIEEIIVRNGNLTVENSGTRSSDQMNPRISVHDGTVSLHSVDLPEILLVRTNGPDGSPAELTASVFGRVEVAGGDVRVTESTVGGLYVRDGAAVVMRDSAVVAGTGGALRGRAQSGPIAGPIPLVTVTDSTLNLRRSTLAAPAHRDAVVLLRATGASVDIADSYLLASGSDLLYGITARRSTVTVQRSYLGLFGGTEQSGIVSGASNVYLTDSMVVNNAPDGAPVRAFQVSAAGNSTPRLQRVLLLRDHGEGGGDGLPRSTSAITRQARGGNETATAAVRVVNDAFIDARDVMLSGWDAFVDRGRTAGRWEPVAAELRESAHLLSDRSVIDPLFLVPSEDAISDGEGRTELLQRVADTLFRLFGHSE